MSINVKEMISKQGPTGFSVKFKLAYRTDAAGKPNNEDDFVVVEDVLHPENKSEMNTTLDMGQCGLLLAVADGMGGMNAGEVASHVATQTITQIIHEDVQNGQLSKEFAHDGNSRAKYLCEMIRKCDEAVKADAASNPEHDGMGSTVIIAWIVDHQATIAWLGDSRAYLFNPKKGIEPISKDHSWVQEQADKHKISYKDTFGHPRGNIVTRSLGDPSSEAKPETRQVELAEGDIVMLCSDGLSGVLFDKHDTYPDGSVVSDQNIEEVMKANYHDLKGCRDALFKAAEESHWYDNVTVLLCRIEGETEVSESVSHDKVDKDKTVKMSTYFISLAALIAVFGIFFLARPKPVDPDAKAFEACKTADDYRAYMRSFGTNALHYAEAKDFVDKYVADSMLVADSMQKAKEQARVESEGRPETKETPQKQHLISSNGDDGTAPGITPITEAKSTESGVLTSIPDAEAQNPTNLSSEESMPSPQETDSVPEKPAGDTTSVNKP